MKGGSVKRQLQIIMMVIVSVCLLSPMSGWGATLFTENFDGPVIQDVYPGQGHWYDGSSCAISSTEHMAGTGSFECHFSKGSTACDGGVPRRHSFTPSNQVYISYWIKHSSSWMGSGTYYHPHMIYLLTNQNGEWDGLSYDRLTAYVEEVQGYPTMILQDGQNIDETKIGVDLTKVTENRSIADCNGIQPGIGISSSGCYPAGSVHWNGITWKAATPYFFDSTKTSWHHVEAYFQLNTISNGIGQPDGIVRYWYDGQLVIDHTNVIIRTGKNANMQFNQFILAPYIGDGSPADQTFWIDNLTVATSRSATTVSPPSAPSNLRFN